MASHKFPLLPGDCASLFFGPVPKRPFNAHSKGGIRLPRHEYLKIAQSIYWRVNVGFDRQPTAADTRCQIAESQISSLKYLTIKPGQLQTFFSPALLNRFTSLLLYYELRSNLTTWIYCHARGITKYLVPGRSPRRTLEVAPVPSRST